MIYISHDICVKYHMIYICYDICAIYVYIYESTSKLHDEADDEVDDVYLSIYIYITTWENACIL